MLLNNRSNIGSVQTLGAFDGLESNGLACLEGLVTIHSDCGVVSEQIVAPIVRKNESKAFCVVEPLHLPCTHGNAPV